MAMNRFHRHVPLKRALSRQQHRAHSPFPQLALLDEIAMLGQVAAGFVDVQQGKPAQIGGNLRRIESVASARGSQ